MAIDEEGGVAAAAAWHVDDDVGRAKKKARPVGASVTRSSSRDATDGSRHGRHRRVVAGVVVVLVVVMASGQYLCPR